MRVEIPYIRQEQRYFFLLFLMMELFFLKEKFGYSCGIACLRMVIHYFGGQFTEMEIIAVADISPLLGMTPRAIVEAAEVLGYAGSSENGMTWKRVKELLDERKPIIALVDANLLYLGRVGLGHFVVIIGLENDNVIFHCPVIGENIVVGKSIFSAAWARSGCEGVIIHAKD
jgi:predicted double-glycine peptidase